ncbi:MAG TPA: Hsp20/alpha crystallin family protein [Nitrospira sp.]|nr:Hsp20/alpha crystallin family protein [Nitrospira sp.]
MAEVPTKKADKESSQEQGSVVRSRQNQAGERGVTRRGTGPLFSLSPREFFTASPFELMRRFTEEMDRFFESPALASTSGPMAPWSPPIEVAERDGQLSISAELPGLRKEDIKVELTQNGLTISGERKREQEEERDGIYRSERSYGFFSRTIPIPEDAEVDQAKATFENGILTVTIPVPHAAQRRREIPIEGGTAEKMDAPSQTGMAKAA